MSTYSDEYEAWTQKSTHALNQKFVSNQILLEDALKDAATRSEKLRGDATPWDVNIHDRAVEKFQQIGNEILAIIEIICLRQGAELLTPTDLPVDQALVNRASEVKDVVETKVESALNKIRDQTARFKFEKAKCEAEIAERARI